MAQLSSEEQAMLKRLTEKSKAPDTPAPSINYTLDLSSDTAYERAVKLGLIGAPEAPNGGEGGEGGEGESDEGPKRRGYFGAES